MSKAERGKKGRKKQNRTESRNESNCAQMAADHRNMNEQCDSVKDDKKMISLAMKRIRDKTFVN